MAREPTTTITRPEKTAEESAAEFRAKYGYDMKDETKVQAFKRIASRRMSSVLDELRKLEPLADKNNYEYSDSQVAQIMTALQESCQNVADRFSGKVKGKSGFQVGD